MDRDRRLSREEFDDVIRRASELAAHESEASSELSEGELYRIASEVGLPEQHVRKALVELRTGALPSRRSPGRVERLFGPETVHAARVVPGTCAGVGEKLDDFLVAGQLLQPVRRSRHRLQYRPSIDWVSQIARAASSTSRRYYTASAKSVEVRLEDLPDEQGRVLVELEVDPGTRGDALGGTALGGTLGGGAVGFGAGALVASTAPVGLAVAAGLVVGGAVAASIAALAGRRHRRKIGDVKAEVEGILDRLELGESLEPPPPSWRKWVERQFHGARKIMEDYTGSSPDVDSDDFGRGP
ncbi:MAG: hypothetical protein PVI57_11515 [Gemmatimonadota bacterium]|jgi:hypothetical protein